MKQSLRIRGLKARQSISLAKRTTAEEYILHQFQDGISWGDVQSVHIYSAQSTSGECSTAGLIDYIRDSMSGVVLTVGTAKKNAAIPREKFDLIIVPIVAFDASCHRVGYGGGWYDRFLVTQPHALKVGLAFEVQKIVRVPTEPHDIPLDIIITEAHIYRVSKNALPK